MIGNVNIQGVRAYDPTTAQWSSPDAYKGEVHDPMSQREYMWNNNNPISYSDPTGYDYVIAVARPADFVGYNGFAHLFIEVGHREKNGTVTVTRFSFAAAKRIIGPLVRQDQHYDAPYSGGHNAFGVTKLASCSGICTKSNGGFNESSLKSTADEITAAQTLYGYYNSNSAFRTLCDHGGGGDRCSHPNTGGHLAPGLGHEAPITK